MNELVLRQEALTKIELFAGMGGGIYGGELSNHQTVCAVELNEHCQKALVQRQRDGILPFFPVWDNIKTFDGRPWRGLVDIVAGGFPCQDISVAGPGGGIDGERSGLVWEQLRVVGEVEPGEFCMENSPALIVRGLDRILGRLSEMGYDCRWGVVGLSKSRTPFAGYRLWIRGYASNSQRLERTIGSRLHRTSRASQPGGYRWWDSEPGVQRVDNGTTDRVERLRAIGNAQVPAVASAAWKMCGPGK